MTIKEIILKIYNKIPIKNHNLTKFKIIWNLKKIMMILLSFFLLRNLPIFFKIAGSDKSQNYIFVYKIMDNLLNKNSVKNILEIGIGGLNQNFSGGSSLLALQMYYKNSKVYGIDIIDKSFLNSEKIFTIKASQDDINQLSDIGNKYGKFDLIIDDGSHFGEHQVITFKSLFPYLSDGGLYIIEDIGGSYTKAFKGDPDFDENKNMIGLIQSKIHAVNSNYLYDKTFISLNEYINIDKLIFVKDCLVIQKKDKNKSEHLTRDEAFRDLEQLNKDTNYNKDKTGFIKTEKN